VLPGLFPYGVFRETGEGTLFPLSPRKVSSSKDFLSFVQDDFVTSTLGRARRLPVAGALGAGDSFE